MHLHTNKHMHTHTHTHTPIDDLGKSRFSRAYLRANPGVVVAVVVVVVVALVVVALVVVVRCKTANSGSTD